MNAALSLTLTLTLMASGLPLTAQDQSETPGAFDLRSPAPVPGPIVRAAIREAVRLAATTDEPTTAAAGNLEQGHRSGPSDWSRVTKLAPGSTITVTLKSGRPASRNFVSADESELIALNLTGAMLPRQVARTLRALASGRPHDLGFTLSQRQTLTEGKVRLGPDGVFLDGRKVAELEQVIEQVARNSVAEISLIHRATRRGFGWGALIGEGIGLAVTLATCGTDLSERSSPCGNLAGLWLFEGPMLGTLIGGAMGAGYRISTVIYRAQ